MTLDREKPRRLQHITLSTLPKKGFLYCLPSGFGSGLSREAMVTGPHSVQAGYFSMCKLGCQLGGDPSLSLLHCCTRQVFLPLRTDFEILSFFILVPFHEVSLSPGFQCYCYSTGHKYITFHINISQYCQFSNTALSFTS